MLLASLYYKELKVGRNNLRNNYFLKAAILTEAYFIEEIVSSYFSWDLADLSPAK